MSQEIIHVRLSALSHKSRKAIKDCHPISDHPVYRGLTLDKKSNARLTPMSAAAFLAALGVVIAYFTGIIDNRLYALIALVAAPIIASIAMLIAVIMFTESSPTHEKVSKLLENEGANQQEAVLAFHLGTNDDGKKVVTKIAVPSHKHEWYIDKLYQHELAEMLGKHHVSIAARAKREDEQLLPPSSEISHAHEAGNAAELISQTSHMATRKDCSAAEEITDFCAQIVDARSITQSTDAYDVETACPTATKVQGLHDQMVEALTVYTHLPKSAAHLELASGKTATEELLETLKVLAREASQLASDAIHAHADKLSFMRRVSTDKYHQSTLDH